MEFRDFTRAFQKDVLDKTLEDLKFIASGCYEEAMKRKAFKDDTGALSSSIGWAVCKDGAIVYSGGFFGNNAEGIAKGKTVVREQSRGVKGIRLILVAGMDYASYVEAKGFDVNTAGELLAEEMINWWLKNA